MDTSDVRFCGSALTLRDAPRDPVPHIAVAGRSNVGKSSFLNWLLRRRVARVAKAPGRTRTLNFYLVGSRFYLVDLPGYGFAKVGVELRREWGRALSRYLAEEQRLAGVVALVDVRHGATKLDLELQELLLAAEVERLVVLTKGDKVGRGKRRAMEARLQRELALPTPPLTVTVNAPDGRREILGIIDDMAGRWRRRPRRE